MIPLPKLALDNAPHSPLAATLERSQSGMKFPFVSVHLRLALLTAETIGLIKSLYPVVTACTYRPTLAFTAVLPVPNRSKATPTRGLMSFQFGVSSIAGKERDATRGVAGYV